MYFLFMYNQTIICLFLNAYFNNPFRYQINYIINDLFSSSNLSISKSTLYKWIKLYSNDPNYVDISKASKITRTKTNSFIYTSRKMTNNIKKYIIDEILKNPIKNMKKLKAEIIEKFSVSLHTKTIWYEIKKNNLTYKNVQYKSYLKSEEEKKIQKDKLKEELLKANKKFISADETHMQLFSRPTRGYSMKGKRCIVKKSYIRNSYSCVAAITEDKIIDFKIQNSSIKGVDFESFLIESVLPFSDAPILLDNASIHKTKTIKKIVEEHDSYLIYNVPYCPEYNPIEYVFNTLKYKLKEEYIDTHEDLQNFLDNFKEEVNKKGLKKYFEKSLSNLFD